MNRNTSHSGRFRLSSVRTPGQTQQGSSFEGGRGSTASGTTARATRQAHPPKTGNKAAPRIDKVSATLCLLILLALYVFVF